MSSQSGQTEQPITISVADYERDCGLMTEPQTFQYPAYVDGLPCEVSTTRWPTERDWIRGDYYTDKVRRLHCDLAWMRGFTVRAATFAVIAGVTLGSLVTWGIMR